MNEQAIQDSYNLFVQNGYNKSIDEFKKLIYSNPQALDDSYNLFVQNGYKKPIDDYRSLMGLSQAAPVVEEPVKKKVGPLPAESAQSFTEFPSEVGPSVSPEPTKPVAPIVSQEPTETVMVGPMGITGLQRTAEYQPAKEFEGKGFGYIVGDLLKTTGKGVVKFPADVLETASIVTAGVKNLIAKTGAVEEADASKFAIYKGAQEYKKLLDEVVPTDKDIANGFWGQTAKAVGEMVPIILSGFVSGGAKAVATAAAKNGTKLQSVINYGKGLASRMATPQGALTISQVTAPSYEQAKSEGATENQALAYALQNALVSYPIEMLPVDGLFKRLDKNLVGNKGVEVLKRAFIGGSEEAITEGLQNVYENVSANMIYGTTKEMLDGVGDASAVGGTVGALMNGLLTVLLGRRAKATNPEEQEQLDKSIEEVKGKVDKIKDNNEKLVETINTLDNSKPRTLSYGSAEYNFTEDPDGTLELAEDDITKEQAEGIINNLAGTYKKINFEIQEVEPEDPYKPTTYRVIGKPIKTEQDAIQKQTTSEVPVQSGAGVSETLEKGKPQAEPQVTPTEGVAPEVKKEEIIGEGVKLVIDKKATEVRGKDHTRYVIFDSNNNEVGSVSFNYREDLGGYQIENIKVSDAGRGIGTNTYRLLINQLDKPLISDSSRTKSADAVWNKLEKEGLVKFDEEQGKYFSIKPEVVTAEGVEEVVTPQEALKDVESTEKALSELPVETIRNLGDGGDLTRFRETLSDEDKQSWDSLMEMELDKNADKKIVKELRDYFKPIEQEYFSKNIPTARSISEEYHKSKQDGTNPELVTAVENLLSAQEPTPIPQVEDLLTLDTKDATVLERVRDFLDKAEADLDKFGRETTGINLAVPVIKAVIKTVKALVNTGITLQEAIRRAAAENNVREEDVVESINYIAKQRELEAKPQGVSEMELPGYNRMIGELEGVIEKSRQRGTTEDVAMQNAMEYLQGSKVYETASDTQREAMVRDVRKMFAKREKAAPKPEKLFAETKDVKEITMDEYELLKKQLADEARGAKNAKTVWTKTSQALAKYLGKMKDGGYVTANQTASIIKKFSSVNMFDKKSIGKFVDYMSKVFTNASYAEQIAQVRAMLPTAKKNAQTKVGVSQTLSPLLKTLFAINPTLIPDSVFADYVEVVSMMGERKAVLDLEESGKLTDKVDEILNAVDEEVSKSEELAEMFDSYDDKVIDEEGNIDFNETIKKMLKEDVITEEDAAIMKKYRKNILPMVQKEAKSEEELQEEKDILIEDIKEASIDFDGLPMKDERNKARELQKLIKTDAVKGLDNTQLKNLLRVIDNINNGYFPHFAQLMVERLNAINNSKVLDTAVMNAKPLPLSTVYSKLKSLLTKKDKFSELIRRNSLYYIDQVFGDFKTKNIFDSIFEKSAEAQAMFKSAVTNLNNRLDNAQEAVAKSFKNDPNKTLMSKFKMMTYMLQLENDSNPGNNQVNPAADYLKATIEHINNGKSTFGERDANMLQEILDKYTDADGNIDNDKLYKSFNPAEKNAIKTIQEINEENREKAMYTAAVIRGDKIHPLNNYIHLNVLHEYKPDEALSGASFVDSYNNSLRPSTKAKSLIARTGKASPLNFDVFASANRGAKFVLMDYYLTEPIRTARKTINETKKLMKEQNASKQQKDIFNAIDNAFEEATDNLLTNNFTSSSFIEDAVAFVSKQGYRAVLASVPRFIGELTSNVAFAAIAAPKDFKTGWQYRGVVMSPNASKIMNNLASKQTNRLFPKDTLSGRLIDTSILNQASGVKGGRAKSDVANKLQQIYNLSLKKAKNVVELQADALIATPDKMVMRPMWFGTFANAFKEQTGKEIDFDKVAEGNEKYMAENKEALDKARDLADKKTVLVGAADNAYMGILKGTPKQNQSSFIKGFNMFNNFMTNFLIYEYATARAGIMAAVNGGSISRKQGAALLGAVATRMTLYTVLTSTLSNAMVGLFVDKEDEDDEKSLLQKIGQAMASSLTSMTLGRDFGNATKGVIGYGVEYMNENYLDFLREGDYDPYKDALQYTIIPKEKNGKPSGLSDLLENMMGPFGPAYKTGELIMKKATESEKEEEGAIERAEKEKSLRIPLEVLGHLGMVPLYKDIRKIVNTEIYKDLDKKPTGNGSGISKEDMKKYFPDMYNELYGPGGALYESEQVKKEINKEKELMKRKIKDEMYNYIPK